MVTSAPFTVRVDTEEVPLQLSRSGNICRYCRHPGVTPVNVTVQGHADPMDALHLMKGVELRRVEKSGEEWKRVEKRVLERKKHHSQALSVLCN